MTWIARSRLGALIAAAALFGSAGAARADVVHLENGSTIEGRAVERGAAVDIFLEGGRVTLDRSEIRRIERGPTREERLQAVLAGMDMEDAGAVRRAADEAARLGLRTDAQRLREMALDREIEERLAAIGDSDAEAIAATAEWARARGAPRSVVRAILERAVRADPASARAREALARLAAEEEAEAAAARREAEAALRERAARAEAAAEAALRLAADERLRRARAETEAVRALAAQAARERAFAGPYYGGAGFVIISPGRQHHHHSGRVFRPGARHVQPSCDPRVRAPRVPHIAPRAPHIAPRAPQAIPAGGGLLPRAPGRAR